MHNIPITWRSYRDCANADTKVYCVYICYNASESVWGSNISLEEGCVVERVGIHPPTQSIRTHTPKIRKKAIQTPMKASRNSQKGQKTHSHV